MKKLNSYIVCLVFQILIFKVAKINMAIMSLCLAVILFIVISRYVVKENEIKIRKIFNNIWVDISLCAVFAIVYDSFNQTNIVHTLILNSMCVFAMIQIEVMQKNNS